MAEEPTIDELKTYPQMTRWFDPVLLAKLLLRVLTADVFGQYADRRLIVAALDAVTIEELWRRCNMEPTTPSTRKDEIWIDYVADLGDGFDATYAIAYLLAQEVLTIDGRKLPRGEALIMGGDEVYPTATRANYKERMQRPYRLAFPDSKDSDARHPGIFMIPGNHDWYDGLVHFLALFCRKKSTAIGSWRTRQRRSYFALCLTERWWLWAIDIALTTDMDQPQADYFVAITDAMPSGSRIILCSSEPGWYKAEEKSASSYNALGYAAWIARNAGKEFDVSVVLSGDTHHYSRYASSDESVQFITAGGGGAFLHGTHSLKEVITAKWLGENLKLSLKTDPHNRQKASDEEACYPTRQQSRKLLWGDLMFPARNYEFSIALGVVYWLSALTLVWWSPDAYFWMFVVLLLGFGGYTAYQEGRSCKLWVCPPYALAHLVTIAGLSWVFTQANACLPKWLQGPRALFWVFGAEMTVIGGAIAGLVFGIYLFLTSRFLDMNHNDAFSAMRLTSYRHFLRMHIKGDALSMYAIGLDRVPARSGWQQNPDRKMNALAPVFKPREDLQPRLIEKEIIVRTAAPPAVGA